MSSKLFDDHELIDATEQVPPPFDDLDLEPLSAARAADGTRENVAAPSVAALRSASLGPSTVVVADELRDGWDFGPTPLPPPHVELSAEVELDSGEIEIDASDTAPAMPEAAHVDSAALAAAPQVDSAPRAFAAEGTRETSLPKLPPLPSLPPIPSSWPVVALPPLPPRGRASLPPPRRAGTNTPSQGVEARTTTPSHGIEMRGAPSHGVVMPPVAGTPSFGVPNEGIAALDESTAYYERPHIEPFVKRSTLALIGGTAFVVIVCIALRVGTSSDSSSAPKPAVAAETVAAVEPAPAPIAAPAPVAAPVPATSPIAATPPVAAAENVDPAAAAVAASAAVPAAATARAAAPDSARAAAPAPAAIAVATPIPSRSPHAAHVATPAPATPAPAAKPVAAKPAAPAAPVAKAAHTAPAKTVAAAQAAASGTLAITTKPPCVIVVDGKQTNLVTPQKELRLPAGHHKLLLVNNGENIRQVRDVTISPNAQTKLILDLRTSK